MLLLDAVNTILRKLGEIDVPSLDEPYPTIPIALSALEEARLNVLKEGWWFNTLHDWTATPALDGTVQLPSNTLIFYPVDPQYVFEGQYIVAADNHDPIIGKSVKGKLVIDKEFERLPYSAAMAITYTAAFETYTADIGPDDTAASIQNSMMGYLATLSAEHTRSRQQNTKHKRAFSRWRRSLFT
jgi:hypothetical protein